ncbi:YbaB/EbfC family nucleoid-associated protein [Parasphingorhabdus pacifica]
MDDQSDQQFLSSLQDRAEDMVRQSQQIQEQLGSLTETASDGGVSVTVSSNGALKDLQIDQRAVQRGPGELSATILRLAGEAQAKVAHQVVQTVEPFAGASAMEFLRTQLPAEPEEPGTSSTGDPDIDDEPPQSFLR